MIDFFVFAGSMILVIAMFFALILGLSNTDEIAHAWRVRRDKQQMRRAARRERRGPPVRITPLNKGAHHHFVLVEAKCGDSYIEVARVDSQHGDYEEELSEAVARAQTRVAFHKALGA